MATKTKRTVKASARVPAMRHREGSKAAKAHQFIRDNKDKPRQEVLKALQKRPFGLAETTAAHWYQTMKKAPIAQPRA